MSLLKDFRDFALKGNVLDLAIGVIIGAAFGKIVDSMVQDILMPPLGLLISGIDFKNAAVLIKDAAVGPDGKAIDAVAIRYGNFLQNILQFTILAFVVFMITRAIIRLQNKKDALAADAPPAAPALSTSEKLLMEIRDSLKASR